MYIQNAKFRSVFKDYCFQYFDEIAGLPKHLLKCLAGEYVIEIACLSPAVLEIRDLQNGFENNFELEKLLLEITRVFSACSSYNFVVCDPWLNALDISNEIKSDYPNQLNFSVGGIPYYAIGSTFAADKEELALILARARSFMFVAAIIDKSSSVSFVDAMHNPSIVRYIVPIFDGETFAVITCG